MTVDELIDASLSVLEESNRRTPEWRDHLVKVAQVYADLAKAKALESRG